MDAGLLWIVVGLGFGLGIAFVARRFMPAKRSQKAPPPPPVNRQQARKQDREAGKRRR